MIINKLPLGGGKIKDATADPQDVRTGKVFYNNNGRNVGNWTPTANDLYKTITYNKAPYIGSEKWGKNNLFRYQQYPDDAYYSRVEGGNSDIGYCLKSTLRANMITKIKIKDMIFNTKIPFGNEVHETVWFSDENSNGIFQLAVKQYTIFLYFLDNSVTQVEITYL